MQVYFAHLLCSKVDYKFIIFLFTICNYKTIMKWNFPPHWIQSQSVKKVLFCFCFVFPSQMFCGKIKIEAIALKGTILRLRSFCCLFGLVKSFKKRSIHTCPIVFAKFYQKCSSLRVNRNQRRNLRNINLLICFALYLHYV